MKKLINVFAILMAIGLCFVSCNHNVGPDSGNSESTETGGNGDNGDNGGNGGGSSSGGSTVKAKDMKLISIYNYKTGERIEEGAELEEASAFFGAVQVKVNNKTDNEYRIEKITGDDFLIQNDFTAAMKQAGCKVSEIGGYWLGFSKTDENYVTIGYTYEITGAKY